jgi:integrase
MDPIQKRKGFAMHPEQQQPRLGLVTEDTFAALVRLFMSPANPKWANPAPKGYSDGTKDLWGRELRHMARPDLMGAYSLQEIRPSLVQAYFDGIADRVGKQGTAMRALKQLERWAIVRDLLPRDITKGVEIGHSDGGHVPWTDEQVALAERRARPEIARMVTLGANTGQRGSDLIRIGPTDIELYDGIDGFNVTQKKTGRQVWVPITSPLAEAMKGWERRPGPYLLRASGKPWGRKDLTAVWTYERDHNRDLEELKRAGLVIHGLRGTACVRLRRAGANEAQIASMVGMSVEMVEHYCRFSIQKENAKAAVLHLEKHIRDKAKKSDRAS